MPNIARHRVALAVTASAGASQALFTSDVITGYVEMVHYEYGSATAISTAANIRITAEVSSREILNRSLSDTGGINFHPRAQAQDTSGGALGFTSAATPPIVPTRIPLAHERARLEVSSAGAAASGGTRGFIDLYIAGI